MARSVRDDGSLPVPEPLASLLARGDGGIGMVCGQCGQQFSNASTRMLTLSVEPVRSRKPGAGSLRSGLGLVCGRCGHGTRLEIAFGPAVNLRTLSAIASTVRVPGGGGTSHGS